jgi:hypothetical protein
MLKNFQSILRLVLDIDFVFASRAAMLGGY